MTLLEMRYMCGNINDETTIILKERRKSNEGD